MNVIQFPAGSVPISVVAKVYSKDPAWVREGIRAGWLPIGTATRGGELVEEPGRGPKGTRTNYYISPMKLYQETGYIWKGEKVA